MMDSLTEEIDRAARRRARRSPDHTDERNHGGGNYDRSGDCPMCGEDFDNGLGCHLRHDCDGI